MSNRIDTINKSIFLKVLRKQTKREAYLQNLRELINSLETNDELTNKLIELFDYSNKKMYKRKILA